MVKEKPNSYKNVLVVGGGIAGIKTALDLAEAGRDVILTDVAPAIGGLMTKLDRTFPTNNCDMCTFSPHLAESGRELHMDIMPLTRVTKCEGEVGQFQITLERRPRFIDLDRCTGCGDCYRDFPECVSFSPGLDPRAPTCMRYPKATPYAFSIDLDKCQDVEKLVNVCRFGAIIPDEKPTTEVVHAGAVVLAAGAKVFDPSVIAQYGYGTLPNVVTAPEYEQLMYAAGPTGGQLIRPSDGKKPERVAWIQCVGSRSIQPECASYCSSACCMFALKEAIVTKERFREDIEACIYYMDMRTFGKDYEKYLNRAKDDFNVKLLRARPHTVEPQPGTDDLVISFTLDDATLQKEVFDMVVLSTGFRPNPEGLELAKTMGVELNEYDFVQTNTFQPVSTSKPGVYVCGTFESPKDIPESIIQASAAAGLAASDVPPAGAPELEEFEDGEEELVAERDVTGEPPKIGVFICDCGENIGGVIPTEKLAEYALDLPHVALAETVGHGCSRESLEQIRKLIREKGLNRVVIGGCSPRTHETKFQDVARKAGLNKYLVEMANLRDQDAWVHYDSPTVAMAKAKDLIRVATLSASLRQPLVEHTVPLNKDVLVVGGGVAGMSAALNLANDGIRVFLVEREAKLGGLAARIRKTLEGEDVAAFVQDLIGKVTAHEKIQVLTSALVVDHTGLPGAFKTGIQIAPQMTYRQLTHGVTVLATGALANRPDQYLLGQHQAVVTQLDLDGILEDQPEKASKLNSVVMIQCVGSRTAENPNCSRVCCQAAVKNALRLKELNPDSRIIVLNRDIRTYGFQEEYFRKARAAGVVFVRYEEDEPPVLNPEGDKISVVFYEPILRQKVDVVADCLVLSTGMIADDENTEDLAAIFRVPRTSDGYFLEEHPKLGPVDLPIPGFLVAGTAHAPKGIRESISQGLAAGGRAKALLAKTEMTVGVSVAKVDGKKCAACLICVRACPYDIPFINADGYSEIDPLLCHGCGICAAECPAKAIQLVIFEDDLILSQVDGIMEGLLYA